MNLYVLLFILLAVTGHKAETLKIYQVNPITEGIAITGDGSNSLWKHAVEIDDFTYPWETEKPSVTSFRALHDEKWLYCLFTVQDSDIKLYVDKNEKREAVRSDRTEIFLRKDASMSPYYCLEIDALARVFDCKAEFYRKLDTAWSWPEGHLITRSNRTEKGYTIEIAISKSSLTDLGLLNNNTIEAGLYRADCIELNGREAKFRWISWVKPDSASPDFHIPSSFGILKLR
jgi:hypothetical protein